MALAKKICFLLVEFVITIAIDRFVSEIRRVRRR